MVTNGESAKGFEFKKFATPRIIGGTAIAIVLLWALAAIFGSSEPSRSEVDVAPSPISPQIASRGDAGAPRVTNRGSAEQAADDLAQGPGEASAPSAEVDAQAPADMTTTADLPEPTAAETRSAAPEATQPPAGRAAEATPPPAVTAPVVKTTPKGIVFVDATIKPLRYELEDRWWGWRPNDLINLTDNVNNFQQGVLEVTRRTVVTLADRISRTGATASYDPNLEEAMNWIMVKASSYWFPSAEAKYRDALEEVEKYADKLKKGKAAFYTRTDNLIPLLATFEDLLGSCNENLTKMVDEDGSPVSFFAVDNSFYYAKGVADSMVGVLEAVRHDFLLTLETRNATELLNNAIASCHLAADIDPWIVLDSRLSSVFANHRANMASPIGLARFYLGQLIKTLST